MCSRFFVRSPKNSAGILAYVKEFLGKMTEKMQTDDVLSRQAVFVRCCPIYYSELRQELQEVLALSEKNKFFEKRLFFCYKIWYT